MSCEVGSRCRGREKRVNQEKKRAGSATGNPPAEARRIRGRGARHRQRRRVGRDEPGGER
jgi:hypothetical protein